MFIKLFVVAAAGEPALSLERAVEISLQNNWELKSSALEVEASRAQLHGASLLFQRNPELAGAIGNQSEIALSQAVEIGGQRAARIDSASAEQRASEARLMARKVVLAAEVREAFGRALAAEQLLQLQREAEALAKQALQAAEERHRAGAASRIEVNTARIELGGFIREKTLALQRRESAFGALRLLLGLDLSHPIALKGELSIPTEAVHLDEKAILDAAMAKRQDLVAAAEEQSAAQAQTRLANREWIPTPRIGVRFEQEETAQVLQGTLAFDLPVFNRNPEVRGVASARARQAELAVAALRLRVQQEARLAASRHEAAHEAAQAYAGGIVQAMQENLALINEGYRAGKIDFFQLLVIRRETLDVRRGYIEALEELNSAEAQLNRTVGRIR